MITLRKILWAGGACPYQIEAITDAGEYFYLRYRGGRLRAGVAPTKKEFWDVNWREGNLYNIIDVACGEPLDGWATHEILHPLLKDKILFPEGFKLDSEHYVNPEDSPFA